MARQTGTTDEATTDDAVAETVETPTESEAEAPETVAAQAADTAVAPDSPAAEETAATEETAEPAESSDGDVGADGETAVIAAPKRRKPWRTPKAPPVTSVAADSEDSDETSETDDEDSEAPEPILVPHRPAGRRLKAVAVAAAVLFVAAGAFAGAMLQPYLADRAEVQQKFQIAETAANAITTLWTYTPDDMDKLPDRSAKYLGGDFAADYKRYIDAIVEPNKQAQVSNNTQVLGAAVESLTPTEATAIVYTNSVATSPVTKGIPSLRYLAYRLTLKRDSSQWLITQMVAVTKLDLTPQL